MKKNDLISVVLPVYKSDKFLNDSVESILKQTYKNIELLIIVEKTYEQKNIINKLNKLFCDKRITIIKCNHKLGLAKSLNYGINLSSGKYIARMDADDISLENRLELQYKYLETHPRVDILATNAEYFEQVTGPWFNNEISFDKLKVNLLINNPICHPTIMFRKNSIQKYNLKYNKKYMSEDYELWCDSIIKGCTINILKDITLKYRKSNENLTSNKKFQKKRVKSVIKTLKKYYKNTLDINLTKDEVLNIQVIFEYDNNEEVKKELVYKLVQINRDIKYFNDNELTFQLGYYSYYNK